MKAFRLLPAMMIMALGLFGLTSCSSDDDEPSTPAARSIEGSYTGNMTTSVMGDEDIIEDLTFTVTAVDDSKVNLSIPAFGNPPMLLPAMVIENLTVSGSDGSYSIPETVREGTLENGKAYRITVVGAYADDRLTINFNLNYGAMPMPMICSFTASKNS